MPRSRPRSAASLAAIEPARSTPPRDFFSLHVLIYAEGDGWLAHCLEFDAVAQGDTADDARAGLMDALQALVADAIAHGDTAGLYRPAPVELWRRFARAPAQGIRLDLQVGATAPGAKSPARAFPATACIEERCASA